MEITRRIKQRLRFYYKYIISLVGGLVYYKKFSKVEKFILFTGYPRSGHTLVASILDAHPEVLIGNEWNSLEYVRLGFSKIQVFYSLYLSSRNFLIKDNNIWTGYNYKIEDSYQGKLHNGLRIIGDKSAGLSTLMIHSNYIHLLYFKKVINKPIILLHVLRNPFDIITTMTSKSINDDQDSIKINNLMLLPKIKMFFDRADTISMLKKQSECLIYDLYHEDIINDPYTILKQLFNYLDINPSDKYLGNCINIINKISNKSRFEADWSDELIYFVQKKINEHDFLRRYSYYT